MHTTKAAIAGQITAEAAEIYEKKFVPALFGQFAEPLLAEAGISPGDSIIDVATGTGNVARAAVEKKAAVVGVDINQGMCTVARRLAPEAGFVIAPAEDLPFNDASFDAAICQFGLMFFENKMKALAEMARVTKSGGSVAVAVFDEWTRSPGYCDLIPLIQQVIGREAAEALKAPFCLGDTNSLSALFREAGFSDVRIAEHIGTVRQPSLDHWLDTEIGGWTLAEMVDDQQLSEVKKQAKEKLAKYIRKDGQVRFPAPAHLVLASV